VIDFNGGVSPMDVRFLSLGITAGIAAMAMSAVVGRASAAGMARTQNANKTTAGSGTPKTGVGAAKATNSPRTGEAKPGTIHKRHRRKSASSGAGGSTISAKFKLFNPATMATPTAGYSQVAEVAGGKIVYIAGQVALDQSGKLVGKDDFRKQVGQVFENLKLAVEAAGGSFNDVIKLNYYCLDSVDPSEIVAVREIRDQFVNTKNPPASTFVVVRRLVRPEWLIEVEATAVVNHEPKE
jgi:enamine deaminase RidA (YjgF/YER057c/UK114 family)